MRHVSSLCAGFLPMKENDGVGVRFLTPVVFVSVYYGTDEV